MAFCVQVPKAIIEASKQYASSCNLGHRGDGSDGSQEQQLIGIIGQNMVAFLMGKNLMAGSTGFDGGVDCSIFGLNFDIKTMGRTVEPKIDFINNLIASQVQFSPDAYLFLSLNKISKILTFCGWLPKPELEHHATLYLKGTTRIRSDKTTFQMKADTYEIPNKNLHHKAKSWTDLMGEIMCYSNEQMFYLSMTE